VHDRRRVLDRLEQVGLDGLPQQHRHRPGGVELLGSYRLAALRVADHDPAETTAKVSQRRGQGERRHHLRRRGDVEPCLARYPVCPAAEAHDDVAEGPVVDVEDPPPGDAVEVDAQCVAAEQVVVQHGAEQIVRCGDRVHVAGEMEVELLHRHHLAVASTGGAAFDAQRGPHRRLADGDHRALPDVLHRLAESDGGGGLALTQRRRRDGGDDHVLRPRAVGQLRDGVEVDLHHVASVRLEQVTAEPHLVGDVLDRLQGGAAGDVQVAR
jgi:hypothetical protein